MSSFARQNRAGRIPPPGSTRHNIAGVGFVVERSERCDIIRLWSEDGTNRLTRACITSLASTIGELARTPCPLIITGNRKFFSAGADLNEIATLTGAEAFAFSRAGQIMTDAVDDFPSMEMSAINGYCMGGGMDLALACDYRLASPHAIFGHRGAALGLITGWGGTQRLARLIGR